MLSMDRACANRPHRIHFEDRTRSNLSTTSLASFVRRTQDLIGLRLRVMWAERMLSMDQACANRPHRIHFENRTLSNPPTTSLASFVCRTRDPIGLRLRVMLAERMLSMNRACANRPHRIHFEDRTLSNPPTTSLASFVRRTRVPVGLRLRVMLAERMLSMNRACANRPHRIHLEDRTHSNLSTTSLTSFVRRTRDPIGLRLRVMVAYRTHREDRIRKCTSIVLFLCQSLTDDNRAGRARKRKGLVVCNS